MTHAFEEAGLNGSGLRIESRKYHKSLRFGMCDTQSAMDIRNPTDLVLEYTRLMMGFVLLQPQPRHILIVGLGGGSLAKFCYQNMPDSVITVVEINPQVIGLRDEFEIPRDQSRFMVIEADGADFVAKSKSASVDTVLIDGYDAEHMSPNLGTRHFYFHICRILRAEGVMSINLHSTDINYLNYIQRIKDAFNKQYFLVTEYGNTILFAKKSNDILSDIQYINSIPSCISGAAWSRISNDMRYIASTAAEHKKMRKTLETQF